MNNKTWKRFDRITCVHYTPHRDRKKELVAELTRVGILPDDSLRFNFEYRPGGVYKKWLKDIIWNAGYGIQPLVGIFDNSVAHYEAIHAALDEGCDSVLILENDVRFLKDVERAAAIVDSFWDSGADFVMFDRFLHKPISEMAGEYTRNGNSFVRFKDGVRGASCYALTRAGMSQFVHIFEDGFLNRKCIITSDCVYDFYDGDKVFTKECACVQKVFPGCANLELWKTNTDDVYRSNGVNLDNYAL